MAASRLSRLEFLIPSIIVLFLALDAAARFCRLEPLAFRGDEALFQFRSPSLPGPFEPNRSYRNDRIHGDLSNSSNQPRYDVFRPQIFSTDSLGFRNPPDQSGSPPDVLMIGSSFTAGSGVTDSDTLPAQVQSLSGCRVFNAGYLNFAIRILSPSDLAKRCGMNKGLIVLECLDRGVGEMIQPPPIHHPPRSFDFLRDAYRYGLDRWPKSPLDVLCKRTYKALQNDWILPNVYKHLAPARQLIDGQIMLFSQDLEKPRNVEGIPRNVEYYSRLRDELHSEGFELAFVIVPDKISVYGDLLREPVSARADCTAAMAELERRLRSRGIPVVNLAPILTAEARRALKTGETLYWRDDTHWNPKGILVSAQAICDAFNLRDRCRGDRGGDHSP